MLFNSFEYLLFLPLVFLLYWYLCRTRKQQNLLVIIASYVFYGWWDWRFLLLIALTTLCSYGLGLAIGRFEEKRSVQRAISAANIIINLLVLGIFKYYNFFAESFVYLFNRIGYEMDIVTLNVILPVGISFYTFQALSYSIDVYQGKIKPTKDIVQFFAFICFFPQLVAGPIERATNLLPQFYRRREFDYRQAVDGTRQMLWGFFKKLVVADNCAYFVNQYWNEYENLSSLMLVQLAVLFSFQIYGDFSGYSDIAIGSAKLFGIKLKKNFDFPYFSRNIGEFWRRWHISLMTWFKDYVYIPLGGNHCSKLKTACNIFIVFLISGLWHGANWTFLLWGGYNAVLLIVGNLLSWNKKSTEIERGSQLSARNIIGIVTTFSFVVLGWIIFRSEKISQFYDYINAIVDNEVTGPGDHLYMTCFVGILIMIVIEWLQQKKDHALQLTNKGLMALRPIRWIIYYTIALITYSLSGYSQDFIYFQF